MDAYGIFQGGGAKGYAHVGALKAAEERRIRFIRIARTSAGAVVAALAAAGYTADELLDATKPLGQRGVLDVDVGDILDAGEYERVRRFQRRYASIGGIPEPRGGLVGWWQRAKRTHTPLVVLRVMKLMLLEAGSGVHMFRAFGAVGTEPVVAWLDGLLTRKIGGTTPVTFGDLGMRLRMVAANLTTGKVHKFGFPGDEDLPVAAAAVASACFPFFFQPVLAGSDMFVDGGLVSNLPVWLFDDERDDDVSFLPTFGFRLVNDALVPKTVAAPAHFIPYALRMVQTLSSGSSALEERRIDNYHGIDLQARIGTLSFETVKAEAPRLVDEARACVERYFAREVGPQDPERMQRVLALVVETLTEHYGWRGGRVRAHVLLPDGDGRHARTVYSCNMDRDADDHLRVRTDVDGVGAAFRLREPVYVSPRPRGVLGPGGSEIRVVGATARGQRSLRDTHLRRRRGMGEGVADQPRAAVRRARHRPRRGLRPDRDRRGRAGRARERCRHSRRGDPRPDDRASRARRCRALAVGRVGCVAERGRVQGGLAEGPRSGRWRSRRARFVGAAQAEVVAVRSGHLRCNSGINRQFLRIFS